MYVIIERFKSNDEQRTFIIGTFDTSDIAEDYIEVIKGDDPNNIIGCTWEIRPVIEPVWNLD